MDFKNGKELLELCQREGLPISQVMRRRECVLGETTADEVERRMTRALEIMRSSAMEPLKNPHRSMGGLIGGEAKRLAAHTAKKAKKHQRSVEAGGKIFRKIIRRENGNIAKRRKRAQNFVSWRGFGSTQHKRQPAVGGD